MNAKTLKQLWPRINKIKEMYDLKTKMEKYYKTMTQSPTIPGIFALMFQNVKKINAFIKIRVPRRR